MYHLERSYSGFHFLVKRRAHTRINENASKNETRLHACSRNDFHFPTYFLCISGACVLYLNLSYAARPPKNYHVPDIRGFYKYSRSTNMIRRESRHRRNTNLRNSSYKSRFSSDEKKSAAVKSVSFIFYINTPPLYRLCYVNND